MTFLADSHAILDSRILPQHQTVITALNAKLQSPRLANFTWLDLACGKGQILNQLKNNLSEVTRKKISYMGYDINVSNTRIASRLASEMEFNHYQFHEGSLSKFVEIIGNDSSFDYITCTNTAHELNPNCFSDLILNSIMKLTEFGELYMYDMESLATPELGALTWKHTEISELINTIFKILDTDFRVQVLSWQHSKCKSWSLTVQRDHINKNNDEITEKKSLINSSLNECIKSILEKRKKECEAQLLNYTKYGAETVEDEEAKVESLYELWALHYLTSHAGE